MEKLVPTVVTKLKRPGITTKDGWKVTGVYSAVITLLGSSLFPDIPIEIKHQVMIMLMEAVKGFSKASPGEIIDWIMRIVAALMIVYSQLLDKDGDKQDGKSVTE